MTLQAGPFPMRPEDQPFYAQIGACLMEWADIDMVFFNLCANVMLVDDVIAEVVYDRTPTLEARMALVDDLFSVRFPKKAGEHDHILITKLKSVIKDVRVLVKTRNRIAHGRKSDRVNIWMGEVSKSFLHRIIPVLSDAQIRKGKISSLNMNDLKEHQVAVHRVAMALRSLREDLRIVLSVVPSPQDAVQRPDTGKA